MPSITIVKDAAVVDSFQIFRSNEFYLYDLRRKPILGNFDNDPDLEIAILTEFFDSDTDESRLHLAIYNKDGRPLVGWPQVIHGNFVGELGAADLNGDGRLELVISRDSYFQPTDGDLLAYQSNGQVLSGFPLSFARNIYATYGGPLALGSLTPRDTKSSIALGARPDGYFGTYLINGGGRVYDRWPQQPYGSTTYAPLLCDANGDGNADMIAPFETSWYRTDRQEMGLHFYSRDGGETGKVFAGGGGEASMGDVQGNRTMSIVLTTAYEDTFQFGTDLIFDADRPWSYDQYRRANSFDGGDPTLPDSSKRRTTVYLYNLNSSSGDSHRGAWCHYRHDSGLTGCASQSSNLCR